MVPLKAKLQHIPAVGKQMALALTKRFLLMENLLLSFLLSTTKCYNEEH